MSRGLCPDLVGRYPVDKWRISRRGAEEGGRGLAAFHTWAGKQKRPSGRFSSFQLAGEPSWSVQGLANLRRYPSRFVQSRVDRMLMLCVRPGTALLEEQSTLNLKGLLRNALFLCFV